MHIIIFLAHALTNHSGRNNITSPSSPSPSQKQITPRGGIETLMGFDLTIIARKAFFKRYSPHFLSSRQGQLISPRDIIISEGCNCFSVRNTITRRGLLMPPRVKKTSLRFILPRRIQISPPNVAAWQTVGRYTTCDAAIKARRDRPTASFQINTCRGEILQHYTFTNIYCDYFLGIAR